VLDLVVTPGPSASVQLRGILIEVPSRSRTSIRVPRSAKTSSCCPSRGWCRLITVTLGSVTRRWYAVCDSVPVLEEAAIQVPPDLFVDKAPPESEPPFEALLPLPLDLVEVCVEQAIQGCGAGIPRSISGRAGFCHLRTELTTIDGTHSVMG